MRVKKLAIGLLATSLCIGCMGMSYGTLGDELVYGEMNGDSLETFVSNLSVLRVSNTNFTLEEIPNSRYVYFKVTMTHKNGTSASTAGTIKRVG